MKYVVCCEFPSESCISDTLPKVIVGLKFNGNFMKPKNAAIAKLTTVCHKYLYFFSETDKRFVK